MNNTTSEMCATTLTEEQIKYMKEDCVPFSVKTISPYMCDPYRKFKKGDKVRIVKYLGRIPLYLSSFLGSVYTVTHDEDANGHVYIDGSLDFVVVPHLELVTPVDKVKGFFLEDEPELHCYLVHFGRPSNFEFVAKLDKDYYSRKEAQAECDRLNAAYRTKQD